MNLKRELQKFRLFLFTPAPYFAGVLGIMIAAVSLSIAPKSHFSFQQVDGSFGYVSGEEEKFSFSFSHCYNSGPSTLELLHGTGSGFVHWSTLPARFTAIAAMEATTVVRRSIPIEKYYRTYTILFGYFNFYIWLFASFSIYSVHWEETTTIEYTKPLDLQIY